MKSVIVGTAGHIDHGKTAQVRALTGIDTDRLQEEKRRGITIDLGFAHLDLTADDGTPLRLGFVDVPGHERFVRNMLAGVGGIDLVLLVIAADSSIQPQTREHFEICRLLNVQSGITVLTKTDLVDPETLDVVRMEVEEFLRGSFLDQNLASQPSPVIAVSAKTGQGIAELKCLLALPWVNRELRPDAFLEYAAWLSVPPAAPRGAIRVRRDIFPRRPNPEQSRSSRPAADIPSRSIPPASSTCW